MCELLKLQMFVCNIWSSACYTNWQTHVTYRRFGAKIPGTFWHTAKCNDRFHDY